MKPRPESAARAGEPAPIVAACPLPCLPAHGALTVIDRAGREHGTVCQDCGQIVSRAEWLELFFGEEAVAS